MSNIVPTSDNKQRVSSSFDLASAGYDKSVIRFLSVCANRLVELTELCSGQQVLDIATGTGTAAIAAANTVGITGQVLGIDIAQGMLEQAQQKIEAAGLVNIELRQEDAGHLSFHDNMFDVVLCASGIFFLTDMLAGLREWQRVTKPGGLVAFSSFTETALNPMSEMLKAQFQKYNVDYSSVFIPSGRPDTPAKCLNLLREAGFEKIETQTEQLGYYLGGVEQWWELVCNTGFRIPLSQIQVEKLEQFKEEHLAAVETLATDKGIWLDVEAIFASGRKPGES